MEPVRHPGKDRKILLTTTRPGGHEGRKDEKPMADTKNLKHIEYELYKNDITWYSLAAFYRGYGFQLEITDLNTGEVVFKKFLRTQDTSYCGNYLRKVVRNNFNAVIA